MFRKQLDRLATAIYPNSFNYGIFYVVCNSLDDKLDKHKTICFRKHIVIYQTGMKQWADPENSSGGS